MIKKFLFLLILLINSSLCFGVSQMNNEGVSTNGTVSSNFFAGNGSLLTNVNATVSTNVVTTNYLAGGVSINGTVSINNLQIATGNNLGKINFGPSGKIFIVGTGNSGVNNQYPGLLLRVPASGAITFADENGANREFIGGSFANLEDKRQFAFNFSTGGEKVKSGERGIMSLKVADDSVSGKTSFITFHKDSNVEIGSISGQPGANLANAQIGVKFESRGADYAEYLYRLNKNEDIKGGDIVGVFAGKISKKTAGANRVMVVSSQPIVLGNWKGKNEGHLVHPVAFVGQVQTQVSGAVHAGDYIIPSGKGDGIGVAISPDNLKADQATKIVGQAWESSTKKGVHYINVAITAFQIVKIKK